MMSVNDSHLPGCRAMVGRTSLLYSPAQSCSFATHTTLQCLKLSRFFGRIPVACSSGKCFQSEATTRCGRLSIARHCGRLDAYMLLADRLLVSCELALPWPAALAGRAHISWIEQHHGQRKTILFGCIAGLPSAQVK